MPKFLIMLLLICGCSGAESELPATDMPIRSIPASLSIAGELQDGRIKEASGLAASRRSANILWTHNDSGSKAQLYALDLTGKSLARARIKGAKNVDWEDIASFVLDETAYLLLADVGDNDSKRGQVTLYVVAEPALASDMNIELPLAWQIDFTYPRGPRDVEAVAVDSENQQVLLLTKRTVPAELYSLPLRPTGKKIEATFLGHVASLPQPSRQHISLAIKKNEWHWQATGMDIAADGSAIAIVSYKPAIYLYHRDGDWLSTLQSPPLHFPLDLRKPESIAFGADSKSLFITNEKKHAPLLRVNFAAGSRRHDSADRR